MKMKPLTESKEPTLCQAHWRFQNYSKLKVSHWITKYAQQPYGEADYTWGIQFLSSLLDSLKKKNLFIKKIYDLNFILQA